LAFSFSLIFTYGWHSFALTILPPVAPS
jgi:hypothetical protein